MSEDEQNRTQGVEFGPLADELETVDYPVEKTAVIERFGDYELELEDDDTTVREVLEPLGETTFESDDEVEQSILSMVGDDAVGREDYTDRGGHTERADGESESV